MKYDGFTVKSKNKNNYLFLELHKNKLNLKILKIYHY